MKFGQFIEYNKSNIFLQKSYRKWDGETSSRSLFVFQRSAAWFPDISIFLKLANNGNKLHTNLDYWSRDIFNFDFLEKGLGIVSSPHFVCDFPKKQCFSCYILLTDQILLHDCLHLLRYWEICVLQFFVNQIKT